jgi:copper resistance protein C
MKIPAILAAAALALMLPTSVLAHVELAASSPAEGSSVNAPRALTVTFNKPVDRATAAANIVMTAMPGVDNHGEMVIRNFTAEWSDDSQTMKLNLRKPLSAGTYELRWQAEASDGHRMSGTVNFTVQ